MRQRIRDDNPCMIDALILQGPPCPALSSNADFVAPLSGLVNGSFGETLEDSFEYIQYFRRGWDNTVGQCLQKGVKDIDADISAGFAPRHACSKKVLEAW